MGRKTIVDALGSRLVNLTHYYDHLEQVGDCVVWTGSRNNAGYGLTCFYDPVSQKRGMMTPHRLAMMLKLDGDIPADSDVQHSCHNRLCCNEAHLSLGTHSDKLLSMWRDGRFPDVRRPGAGRPKKIR
jgi:hypothetical protein